MVASGRFWGAPGPASLQSQGLVRFLRAVSELLSCPEEGGRDGGAGGNLQVVRESVSSDAAISPPPTSSLKKPTCRHICQGWRRILPIFGMLLKLSLLQFLCLQEL